MAALFLSLKIHIHQLFCVTNSFSISSIFLFKFTSSAFKLEIELAVSFLNATNSFSSLLIFSSAALSSASSERHFVWLASCKVTQNFQRTAFSWKWQLFSYPSKFKFTSSACRRFISLLRSCFFYRNNYPGWGLDQSVFGFRLSRSFLLSFYALHCS